MTKQKSLDTKKLIFDIIDDIREEKKKMSDKKKAKELECNCIMSGYAQTTNFCPVHKNLSMKPKELDWSWIKLDKPLGVIVNQGMDRPFLVYGFNLFKQRVNLEVNNLLTQQRTELLEEIKKEIIKITDNGYDCVCSSYIEDYFKSLLNKKDE